MNSVQYTQAKLLCS